MLIKNLAEQCLILSNLRYALRPNMPWYNNLRIELVMDENKNFTYKCALSVGYCKGYAHGRCLGIFEGETFNDLYTKITKFLLKTPVINHQL